MRTPRSADRCRAACCSPAATGAASTTAPASRWPATRSSASHQRYLAAGGLGFFIGDGRLSYRPERTVELFYSAGVLPRVWLSINAQRVFAPAYNADRGPATVVGLRLHTNF